jgi:hypothetical protein
VASQSEYLLQTLSHDLAFRSWQCASHSKTMQSQCASKLGRGWTAEEECKYAGNVTPCVDRLKVLFCSLSVAHYNTSKDLTLSIICTHTLIHSWYRLGWLGLHLLRHQHSEWTARWFAAYTTFS